jgi:hypothetical protein
MQEFNGRTTRTTAAQDDRQQKSGSLECEEEFLAKIDRGGLFVKQAMRVEETK